MLKREISDLILSEIRYAFIDHGSIPRVIIYIHIINIYISLEDKENMNLDCGFRKENDTPSYLIISYQLLKSDFQYIL